VHLSHLIRRFFGSLWIIGPSPDASAWAQSHLTREEVALWTDMSMADRRHSIVVARRVELSLGIEASQAIIAAALLHDVGKSESGLGTYGRVIATISGAVAGHDANVIRAWTRTTGFTRKVGLYLQHARLGGDLLAMAGSDPLTEAWAREHHLPSSEWSVPLPIGEALKAADDD